MEKTIIPNVLTIAGVDPSGGAGILADIKAISALGGYGCGVIAALTAQNTCAVTGVCPVPASFVREQLETLFADVRIDAVKIGMLSDVAVRLLKRLPEYLIDIVRVLWCSIRSWLLKVAIVCCRKIVCKLSRRNCCRWPRF